MGWAGMCCCCCCRNYSRGARLVDGSCFWSATSPADSFLHHPYRLKLLRLEKSYWLRLEDRWSPTSLRSVARLQQQRSDLRVAYLHEMGVHRVGW